MAVQFSNATSGVKLTDAHNGLRAFNRHVADTMRIKTSDMTHASEIIEIISKNRYSYVEVPVTIDYTEYSTSKGQSVLNAVNIVFRHPASQGQQPVILVQLLPHRRDCCHGGASVCVADRPSVSTRGRSFSSLPC